MKGRCHTTSPSIPCPLEKTCFATPITSHSLNRLLCRYRKKREWFIMSWQTKPAMCGHVLRSGLLTAPLERHWKMLKAELLSIWLAKLYKGGWVGKSYYLFDWPSFTKKETGWVSPVTLNKLSSGFKGIQISHVRGWGAHTAKGEREPTACLTSPLAFANAVFSSLLAQQDDSSLK